MRMRDRYLFKAKRLDTNDWILGFLSIHKTGKYFIRPIVGSALSSEEVDKNTICQCIGLKDKNGKLIWENDIVSCLTEECCGYIGWNEREEGFYFNVLLENGRFEEEHIYDYQDDIEIIGNVFDNPELLESEE